jgi:hypothetical protein
VWIIDQGVLKDATDAGVGESDSRDARRDAGVSLQKRRPRKGARAARAKRPTAETTLRMPVAIESAWGNPANPAQQAAPG